jgi:biopolymer transport protein ExbD
MLGVFLAVSSVVLLIAPAEEHSPPPIMENTDSGIDLPLVPSEIDIRLIDSNRILVNGSFVDSKMVGVRLAELMSFQPGATIHIQAAANTSVNELVKLQNAARRAAGADAVIVELGQFDDEVTSMLLR